jgi:hypothetical protein
LTPPLSFPTMDTSPCGVGETFSGNKVGSDHAEVQRFDRA